MKITKDLEPNWKNRSSLQLFNVLKVPKLVILMDDLNKDGHIHDREDHKKLPHHPPSSSKSVLPETSEKIRISAWITLVILGCTLLVTFYGETMLLPDYS